MDKFTKKEIVAAQVIVVVAIFVIMFVLHIINSL